MTLEDRLRSFEIILSKGVGTDEKWLADFIDTLFEFRSISKAQKKALQQVLSDRGFDDAVRSTVSLFKSDADALQNLHEAINNRDLETSQTLKDILICITSDDRVSNDIVALTLLWEGLVEYDEEAKVVAKIYSLGDHWTDSDPWPLNFIHSCVIKSEEIKLSNLIRAISDLKKSARERLKIDFLNKLLIDCIRNNEETLFIITRMLKNRNVIDDDQQKKIEGISKSSSMSDAIDEMTRIVQGSQDGIKSICAALDSKDLAIDSKAKDLIQLVVNKEFDARLQLLFSCYDQLKDYKEDIVPVVEKNWQMASKLTYHLWPIHFIHFCVHQKEEDKGKVDDFLSAISILEPPTNNSNDPTFSQYDQSENSFVFISEDFDEKCSQAAETPPAIQNANKETELMINASQQGIYKETPSDIALGNVVNRAANLVNVVDQDPVGEATSNSDCPAAGANPGIKVVCEALQNSSGDKDLQKNSKEDAATISSKTFGEEMQYCSKADRYIEPCSSLQNLKENVQEKNEMMHESSIGDDEKSDEASVLRGKYKEAKTQKSKQDGSSTDPGSVEFRLRIEANEPSNSDWIPYLKLQSLRCQLKASSQGYYHIRIPCGEGTDCKYSYYYKKGKKDYSKESRIDQKKRKFTLKIDENKVIFDVAALSDSCINDAFKKFLFDMPESADDFTGIVPYLLNWVESAYGGSSQNDSGCFPKPEKVQTMLHGWLIKKEHSVDPYNFVIYCLAVVHALFERKKAVHAKELFNMLSEGLALHKFDRNTQQQIFRNITTTFTNGISILDNALQYFIVNAKKNLTPNILLILPLQYMIRCNGHLPEKRGDSISPNMLKERALIVLPTMPVQQKSIWEKLREEFLNSGKTCRDLASLHKTISDLALTHPYMVDVYQYFLSTEILLDLIKSRQDITMKFQIDSVVTQLLQEFEKDDKKNLQVLQIITQEEYMSTYLSSLFEKIISEVLMENNKFQNIRAIQLLKCISKVLKKLSESERHPDHVLWLLSMASKCAQWLVKLRYDVPGLNSLSMEISVSVQSIISEKKKKAHERDIELFDDLLCICWYDEDITSEWMKKLSAEMQKYFERQRESNFEKNFLKLYCKIPIEKLHGKLQNIMIREATECFHTLLRMKAIQKGEISINKDIMKMFITIFDREFDKKEDESSFNIKAIRFLGESQLALSLYNLFDHEMSTYLCKMSQTLKNVNDIAVNLKQRIIEKRITATEAQIILNKEDAMEELLSVIDAYKRKNVPEDQTVTSILRNLRTSISSMYDKRLAIACFIDFCKSLEQSNIKVDSSHVGAELEENLNESSTYLSDAEKWKFKDMDDMMLMSTLRRSECYKTQRKNIAQKIQSEALPNSVVSGFLELTCEEAFEQIWKKVKSELQKCIKDLLNGSLTPDEITKLFCATKGNLNDVREELKQLLEFDSATEKKDKQDDKIATEASKYAEEIANIFIIQRNKEFLEWICKFKTHFKLKGDFDIIDTFKDKKFELQGDKVSKLIEIPSAEHADLEVLKMFLKEEELIKWLQLKGEEDIKATCLAAEQSSLHNLKHATLWSNLRALVDLFSDLIFRVEEINSISQLMTRCKNVWEKNKECPSMGTNWAEAGTDLNWYKENENWHGSEEKAAVYFAQKTNKHGIYKIGRLDSSHRATTEGSIKLTFPSQGEDAEKDCSLNVMMINDTEKSLSELLSIQSILMIIENEEEERKKDIKQFVRTLIAMQGLTDAFVDLYNAGFVLFNEWYTNVSSTCEDDFIIAIKFKNDLPELNLHGTVADIDRLSEKLKEILSEWKNDIAHLRLQHYFLNEYSIQQIKFLCEQLGKPIKFPLKDQVYLLLSNLPCDILNDHILYSLEETRTWYEADERYLDGTEQADCKMTEKKLNIRQKQEAVRQLIIKKRTTEQKAKAAVQTIGPEDLDKCSMWITMHESNNEEIEEKSREFDCCLGAAYESLSDGTTLILDDVNKLTVEEIINYLQQKVDQTDITSAMSFILDSYMKNTKTNALKDYLSVHHLGKFLTILRTRIKSYESMPKRIFKDNLIIGQPNLILTDENNTIPYLLSIYTNSSDDSTGSCLPTPYEVLICSKDTKAEEVNRFLLRAMCKNPVQSSSPIFCMACIEKLELRVATEFEHNFKRLSKRGKRINEKYQLVLISSSKQHYLSVVFSKYIVRNSFGFDQSDCTFVESELGMEAFAGYKGVEVVASFKSGVGKSLYIKRQMESLPSNCKARVMRLLERRIDKEAVIQRLCVENTIDCSKLIHIDITPAVDEGLEKFLFDLLITGLIKDDSGKIWRKRDHHAYVIEITMVFGEAVTNILNMMPRVTCISPVEVLYYLKHDTRPKGVVLLDDKEYQSDAYQRTCQYLLLPSKKISHFIYSTNKEKSGEYESLDVLLKNCGIDYPSWAQLKHFITMLNTLLINCEKNIYNQTEGLKELSITFMKLMARDFASPSLVISDESSKNVTSIPENSQSILDDYKIIEKRKWEESEHPFIIFNDDNETMTFINVNINQSGYLCYKDGKKPEKIITKRLVECLKFYGVDFGYNFHKYSREKMLDILCKIIGIDKPFDPDNTYELTSDNVLKMIAIFMRFKSGIPVIIMGETGCGKTRMVDFMGKLMATSVESSQQNVTNSAVKVVKVHAGMTTVDIFSSVSKALEEKKKILFFDEANTTTAIYAIKEVMCDFTINGDLFSDIASSKKLHIVAACNPYKQMSPKAIQGLKDKGLQHRVPKDEKEKMVETPIINLVYRVVSLPPSIQPFVWDFGTLSDDAEEIYIRNMIQKLMNEKSPDYMSKGECKVIVALLSNIQKFMRKQEDECRYVSLRDIERTIVLYNWFQKKRNLLFPKMDRYLRHEGLHHISNSLRCMIQAIGVSYYVSLEKRVEFRREISSVLFKLNVEVSATDILSDFEACQEIFHRNLRAGDNVAWNNALKENIFLMAVCADTKLPLYIIGKPGSSKSLAKSIFGMNMEGRSSSSEIFRNLKKVEMLSFQCSAKTEPSGIEQIFKTAMAKQQKLNSEKDVVLLVLDEMGLAEESSTMPLKVLHPLLEYSNTTDESLKKRNDEARIAFVGISNWTLDPAKMNRGVFVTRGKPKKSDLLETCEGLGFSSSRLNQHRAELEDLTETYLNICENHDDQFYGLRDYYSMIKMFHSITEKLQSADNQQNYSKITKDVLMYIIKRNFSGGNEMHQNAVQIAVGHVMGLNYRLRSNTIELKSLISDSLTNANSRSLLLLTKHHASVHLLHHIVPEYLKTAIVIFGSSFSGDNTYTELCRSIQRIKVCMEKGKWVILLNMVDIHESLYDVLNQHYMKIGSQQLILIGIGSHRVWTKVHKDFRLIVIENEKIAYNQSLYPIPLLNRLEKHHLVSTSLLTIHQLHTHKTLSKWVKDFAEIRTFTLENAFPGIHEDTTGSVILAYSGATTEKLKEILLDMATADSVFRLHQSRLDRDEVKRVTFSYVDRGKHDSLYDLLKTLQACLFSRKILQVVSFSNVLTEEMPRIFEEKLHLAQGRITLLFLELFNNEQEYGKAIDSFLKHYMDMSFKDCCNEKHKRMSVLLIQQNEANLHGQLIESAKHYLYEKLEEANLDSELLDKLIVIFILSTERFHEKTLILQPTAHCETIFVDELSAIESNAQTTLTGSFYQKSLSNIMHEGRQTFSENNFLLKTLSDCIYEAMSEVNGSNIHIQRQKRRMKMLKNITRAIKDNDTDKNSTFVKILFDRMRKICKKAEDKGETVNWVEEEANSNERLQEGGSFGRVINLCLKRHMSCMLAQIVSIIDVNGNMSAFSCSEMKWQTDLWLKIFQAIDFEDPASVRFKYSILDLRSDMSANFPFSFFTTRMMQEKLSRSRKENEEEIVFYNAIKNCNDKYFCIVREMWHSASKKNEMMKAYTNDLLQFNFSQVMKKPEFDAIAKILFEFSKKRCSLLEEADSGLAILFYQFMSLSDKLHHISEAFQTYPHIIGQLDEWCKKQLNCESFQIHTYALNDLLKEAYVQARRITKESCIEWMNKFQQVKKICKSLLDMVSPKAKNQELLEEYKKLSVLEALLSYLLPVNQEDPDQESFITIAVNQAQKYFKAFDLTEFGSPNFNKVILDIPREAYYSLKDELMNNLHGPVKCICRKATTHEGLEKAMLSKAKERTLCHECAMKNLSNKLLAFKANTTGFILEYLHQYWYKEDETSKSLQNKIEDILDCMMHSHTNLQNDMTMSSQLDLNLATITGIIGSLQAVSCDFVSSKLKKILQSLGYDETLYLATLKAFENRYQKDFLDRNPLDEENLIDSWVSMIENKEKSLTIEMLSKVAKLRFASSEFVKYVYNLHKIVDFNHTPTLILEVERLCKTENASMIRDFINQTGVLHHGRMWFRYLKNHESLKEEVVKMKFNQYSVDDDLWEIFGQEYKNQKQNPGNGTITDEPIYNSKANLLLQKILSYLRGSCRQKVILPNNRKEWKVLIQGSAGLKSKLEALVKKGFITQTDSDNLWQLIVSSAGAILCRFPMGKELYYLLSDPQKTSELFWPAMPESLYHQVHEAMNGAVAYSCPKGHVYYIGECTYPWMMSRCPECGSAIGGFLHMAAAGNLRLSSNTDSRKGYQLNSYTVGVKDPSERVTLQSSAAIQFLLHSAMMLALCNQETSKSLLKIMNRGQNEDGYATDFLIQRLWKNVEDLSSSIGCSVDDGVLVMQQIIVSIASCDYSEFKGSWDSESDCQEWEKEFRRIHLLPVLKETEKKIFEAKKCLTNRIPMSYNTTPSTQRMTVLHPLVWIPLRDPSVEHLLHNIIDSPKPGIVLQLILQTPNLHLVKKLKDILELQSLLISRYHHKFDLKDVENIKFFDLRNESEEMKRFTITYMNTWNKVHPILGVKHNRNETLAKNMKKIKDDTPITIAIPSTRGRGICAKLLAEYLIQIQNDFLDDCAVKDPSIEKFAEVEVAQLLDSHYVCVDKQEDLMPMIRNHTSYTFTSDDYGHHHYITYNIPQLEKMAKEKYVMYKKKILKKSLPCIRYADTGIGDDWKKVEEIIPQRALPQQIRKELDKEAGAIRLADICEKVRILTRAIGFLSKLKSEEVDGRNTLQDFLNKEMMMAQHDVKKIPNEILVEHTLALYQNLTCHRAIRFYQEGLDPYEYLSRGKESVEDRNVLKKLKEYFETANLLPLQCYVNETLLKTDLMDFEPQQMNWDLRDFLPYVEYLTEDDDESLLTEIPEGVQLKHIVSFFRLSVEGIFEDEEA